MLSITSLDLTDARQLAEVALANAAQRGVLATVVVLDATGVEKVRLRMDGGSIASGILAGNKARAALLMRAPTSAWVGRMADNEYLRAGLWSFPEMCPLPGGLPIIVNGAVVGSIGVSGGTVYEDEDIAKATVADFGIV